MFKTFRLTIYSEILKIWGGGGNQKTCIKKELVYLMATTLGDENISCSAALTCDIPTKESLVLEGERFSAISVARLQMSRARLASPDTAATFLAAN